jgi:plastocyanin domain-containing protein
MTLDRVIVDLAGLGLIAFIAWFFWLGKRKGVRAAVVSSGYQEQTILVRGGYTPDVIVVDAGRPVRLNFVRQESASCSDTVVFPAFGKSAELPEGQAVRVEIVPSKPGEYEFGCPMGMFRGKILAE